MKESPSATRWESRPFTEADEPEVLGLLDTSLGGSSGAGPRELFRWKHLRNPFGPSLMLVAEAEGNVVGFRAFLRWRFRAPRGGDVRAVRPVDTATHPDYRRRGIFSSLTLAAVESVSPESALIFNTPNRNSRPGYLKMGWQVVRRFPIALRPRRPLRVLARSIRHRGTTEPVDIPVDAEPATTLAGGLAELSDLVEESIEEVTRLTTPTSVELLRWRYAMPPALTYWLVREEQHGHLRGIAIFRIQEVGGLLQCSISELIAHPGDRRTARSLLQRAVRAAPVDYAICHFPSGSGGARAAKRVGFMPSPLGTTLAVRPLDPRIEPDPLDGRSWALSLGDLEVF